MFAPVAPTDWSVIEAQLRRKCRSDEELQSNLVVARGLHHFATESKMLGRAEEFFPLAMGAGQKVSYWLSMVLSHEGRSEEHTSELQSLMRISYAVFCLKKKKNNTIL